jgi:hypothetical protein
MIKAGPKSLNVLTVCSGVAANMQKPTTLPCHPLSHVEDGKVQVLELIGVMSMGEKGS